MTIDQSLEAVLFAGAKAFSVKQLMGIFKTTADDIEASLTVLSQRLDTMGSGVMLQRKGNDVELVTRPEAASFVAQVISIESQGELTQAALEALTILAYRGPLTRPELEQIRGVHSAIILRNLLLRGFIEEAEGDRFGQILYSVTFDFLNHLGLASVEQLPDYALLHGNETVSQVLSDLKV
jgi:segregation and condensation protein B